MTIGAGRFLSILGCVLESIGILQIKGSSW